MSEIYIVDDGRQTIRAELSRADGSLNISLNGNKYRVQALEVERNVYSMLVNDKSYEVAIVNKQGDFNVYLPGVHHSLKIYNEGRVAQTRGTGAKTFGKAGWITAPMPGKVVKILVKKGEQVTEGMGLIVIEAMKMGNELKSPVAGVVKTVHVEEGVAVEGNEPLLEIEQDQE